MPSDRRGRFSFPGSARLRRACEFRFVLASGRRISTGRFRILCRKNESSACRLGIVVGRKSGCAVERNWIKRRLREFFRLNAARLCAGTDLVVQVTAPVSEIKKISLSEELTRAFDRLGIWNNGDSSPA